MTGETSAPPLRGGCLILTLVEDRCYLVSDRDTGLPMLLPGVGMPEPLIAALWQVIDMRILLVRTEHAEAWADWRGVSEWRRNHIRRAQAAEPLWQPPVEDAGRRWIIAGPDRLPGRWWLCRDGAMPHLFDEETARGMLAEFRRAQPRAEMVEVIEPWELSCG